MANFVFVNDFQNKHGREWVNILAGEKITNEFLTKIEEGFSKLPAPLSSSDLSLVVFGSIARNECSENRDIDWTVLIDGQAKPDHEASTHIVKKTLRESAGLKDPGTSGMFGHITFSHDLIHYIGGEGDTNHNISKRILLLLESDSIDFSNADEKEGTAWDRVIRGIITEYISHDSGFLSERGKTANVPRFLLNDVVRFWRTMCVDFAYKQKKQGGENWALRNIKLRMSRKLIYIKGMLMCFSCYKDENLDTAAAISNHLRDLALMKPLDVLIKVCTKKGIEGSAILPLFDSYDEFLGVLANNELRDKLSNLNMFEVYEDKDFLDVRRIADDFQAALDTIFLVKEGDLREFTFKYALF